MIFILVCLQTIHIQIMDMVISTIHHNIQEAVIICAAGSHLPLQIVSMPTHSVNTTKLTPLKSKKPCASYIHAFAGYMYKINY